jgi:hypothetical protein
LVEDLPKGFVAQFSHEQSFTQRRAQIMVNVSGLREQIGLATSDEEKEAYEASLRLEIAALKKVNEEQQLVEGGKAAELEPSGETA